jgi:cell division protein FtsQ
MSVIAAPADKRFRRAHVKPMRRRHSAVLVRASAKYGVVLALTVLALYRGGAWLANAGALRIDRISVHGNKRMSSDDVLAVLAPMRGENLMWTDLDRWRQRLLESHWIKEAALRRSLPSSVDVALTERVPIALARLNKHLYLVDDAGTVIDEYGPDYADLDLPVVDGLIARTAAGTPASDGGCAALASRAIAALAARPELAKRVSQIDVSDPHNAAMTLTGDRAVIYVGDDRFLPRLESYMELGPTLAERVAEIDYVDLRFDDRIYVRPSGKAGKKGAVTIPR